MGDIYLLVKGKRPSWILFKIFAFWIGMMASKFHVSPRLFAQILPLQSRTASADVSSAPMGDGEASRRRRRRWPGFAERNAVNSCEASPTAFQRGQLQWQDLGKKSKAKVKLWSRHVNSGSKNLKKYSTRSFPFDLKIIIFDVTAFQKKIMSSLLMSQLNLQFITYLCT